MTQFIGWVIGGNALDPSRDVADFGYDLYLFAITELLNHIYFRLLNFYFHTLIQQRLICQQFVPFLANAAGIGVLSGVIGMIISGALDFPSGLSIVLIQLFGFLAVALWFQQVCFDIFMSE